MKFARRRAHDAQVPETAAPETSAAPTFGPMDASLVGTRENELNFGSLRLMPVADVDLRLEVDNESGEFSAIQASIAGSTLQIQAFAAPKSSGIWDAVRADLCTSVEEAGGSVTEEEGPWGTEILARLPHSTGGASTFTPVRFIGVEGPRWFLRVVLSGADVDRPEEGSTLGDLLRSVSVNRGDEPRAPRELLPLEIPSQAKIEEEPQSGQSFEPFTRGPEITEVR